MIPGSPARVDECSDVTAEKYVQTGFDSASLRAVSLGIGYNEP